MLHLQWDENLSAKLDRGGWHTDTPSLQALLDELYPAEFETGVKGTDDLMRLARRVIDELGARIVAV